MSAVTPTSAGWAQVFSGLENSTIAILQDRQRRQDRRREQELAMSGRLLDQLGEYNVPEYQETVRKDLNDRLLGYRNEAADIMAANNGVMPTNDRLRLEKQLNELKNYDSYAANYQEGIALADDVVKKDQYNKYDKQEYNKYAANIPLTEDGRVDYRNLKRLRPITDGRFLNLPGTMKAYVDGIKEAVTNEKLGSSFVKGQNRYINSETVTENFDLNNPELVPRALRDPEVNAAATREVARQLVAANPELSMDDAYEQALESSDPTVVAIKHEVVGAQFKELHRRQVKNEIQSQGQVPRESTSGPSAGEVKAQQEQARKQISLNFIQDMVETASVGDGEMLSALIDPKGFVELDVVEEKTGSPFWGGKQEAKRYLVGRKFVKYDEWGQPVYDPEPRKIPINTEAEKRSAMRQLINVHQDIERDKDAAASQVDFYQQSDVPRSGDFSSFSMEEE